MVCDISTIPKEILNEIFFKLPPADLRVLILVCKLWHEIIEDGFFIESVCKKALEKERGFCPSWPYKKKYVPLKLSRFPQLECWPRLASRSFMPLSQAVPILDSWISDPKQIKAIFWDKKRTDVFLGDKNGKILRFDLKAPEKAIAEFGKSHSSILGLCQTPSGEALISLNQDFEFTKWSLKDHTCFFSVKTEPLKFNAAFFESSLLIHPYSEEAVIMSLKTSITVYDIQKKEVLGGLINCFFYSSLTRCAVRQDQKVFCTFGTHEIFVFEISSEMKVCLEPKEELCFVKTPIAHLSSLEHMNQKEAAICCLEMYRETLFSMSRGGSLYLIDLESKSIRTIKGERSIPLALNIRPGQIEILSTLHHLRTVTFWPPKEKVVEEKKIEEVPQSSPLHKRFRSFF